MKRYFIIIILFLSIALKSDIMRNQRVMILDINSDIKVLEEWKTPGLYSPVNLIDGDINTCYAVDSVKNYISIILIFDKPVNIDELRIMNGLGKNIDLFYKNNRIAKLDINLYSPDTLNKKTDPETESIIIKDQRELQSIKLKKNYLCKKLDLSNINYSGEVYKGSKYNDTCITEVEFYYKGEKLKIQNVNKLKEDYIKKIGNRLIHALSNKNFCIDRELGYNEMRTYNDGHIEYNGEVTLGGLPLEEVMPDKWKVEKSMLYLRLWNKWILYNYELFEHSLILYTNPYSEVPDDFPYRLFYKRLPDNYQLDMDYKEDIKSK